TRFSRDWSSDVCSSDLAPRGLDTTGDPVLNRIWTATGNPCVTVPGLTGPQGLPVGVQVVGAYAGDAKTLAVADWVMAALRPAERDRKSVGEGARVEPGG